MTIEVNRRKSADKGTAQAYHEGIAGHMYQRNYYMEWTGTLANSKAYCLDDGTDAQLKTAFDSLENKIIYAMASGTVTDTITDYFDLVQSEVPFTLTVGGKALTGVKTADNEYAFGDKDANGVYPYTVKLTGKTFVWTINVPIENTSLAQLSYKLQLLDLTKSGTFDTNVSATLDAKDSNGDVTAQNDPFSIPNVTYVVNSNSGGTTNEPANNNSSSNSGTTNNSSSNNNSGSNNNSSKPDTGDSSDIGLWAMLGVTGIALMGTVIAMRKKSEQR